MRLTLLRRRAELSVPELLLLLLREADMDAETVSTSPRHLFMNGYHENSHESINPLRILRIAFSVSCLKARTLRMSRGFTAISHLLVVKRRYL